MDIAPTTNLPTGIITPQRKLAAFFILVFILLLIIPAHWLGLGNQKIQYKNEAPTVVENKLQETNADPDGDGVPNWQEALLGTDPHKADSNGNGTPDGEENKLGSFFTTSTGTPYAQMTAEEKASYARLNDPNNITSLFAKNSLTMSAYMAQQGATEDADVTKATNAIVDDATSLITPRVYTSADITIKNDSSLAALKEYGNTLGTIFINTMRVLLEVDDLAPLNAYLKSQNIKDLNPYEKKISAVEQAIASLQKMTTPKKATELQLQMINTVEVYRYSLYNISKAGSDPARAIVGLKMYKDSYDGIVSLLQQGSHFFDINNVIFSQKDPGYLFMNITSPQ